MAKQSLLERIFGRYETPQVATDPTISTINSKFDNIAKRLVAIETSVLAITSDYYNGKAADHAMDVAKSSPDAGGGRAFWNMVEARSAGAGEITHDDDFTGSHTYIVKEVGKTESKTIDADALSFKGDLVVFLRYNRVVYVVHATRLTGFELKPKPYPTFPPPQK